MDNSEESKKVLKTELETMRRRMRCVFWLLHFTRNSIKWRSQYYYSFIFLMLDQKSGCSHWNELPEAIVTPWESAKYSFDQMYSLIKAWASHPDTLTSLLDHSHPQGQDFIGDMLKNLTDKIGDTKTAIEQLKKALDGSIINDAKNREYQAKAAELLDILQSIVQSKSEKRE